MGERLHLFLWQIFQHIPSNFYFFMREMLPLLATLLSNCSAESTLSLLLLLTVSKKLSKTLNASAFWGQDGLSKALPGMIFAPPCSQQWSQQSCSPLWHCTVSCYICSPSGKIFPYTLSRVQSYIICLTTQHL